jgi:hypothetical protein
MVYCMEITQTAEEISIHFTSETYEKRSFLFHSLYY